MMAFLRRTWDNFRGSGDAAVTVPPMDGALRPNQLLEQAPRLLALAMADNLVTNGTKTVVSAGRTVFELDPLTGDLAEIHSMEADVSALALDESGNLAIGLDDGRVTIRGGRHNGKAVNKAGSQPFHCPTALLFLSSDELVIAEGSTKYPPGKWKFDLMERGSTGSVHVADLGGGKASPIAGHLAWPCGLVAAGGGRIAISEAWRHQVIVVDRNGGKPKIVLEDLPGYPGRLSASGSGGYWLCVFAPRGQMIEFVLREKEFRKRMMTDIQPDYWMAPSLVASHTFLEPLQGGAQIHLGMLKPWAPARSYGLLVQLDLNFNPLASYHSRADGKRHGITSSVEVDGRVLVTSRGAGDIATLTTGAPRAVVPGAEEH